jgi:hypothetical protein
VFVTNHAFHSNLTAPDSGMQLLAAGFKIPDFGPDAQHQSYKGVLEARAHHSEMFSLVKSMQTHYEIPSTFNAEMPQLAFQDSGELPRLQFGRTYLVPTADGREVPGRLYDAVVEEDKKQVVGCYELATGVSVLATSRSLTQSWRPIGPIQKRFSVKSAGPPGMPRRWSICATSSTRRTRIRRATSRSNGWQGHPTSSDCGRCRRKTSPSSSVSAGPIARFKPETRNAPRKANLYSALLSRGCIANPSQCFRTESPSSKIGY